MPISAYTGRPSMAYNFDVRVQAPGYTIEIDSTACYGYFENDETGDGGGLWFAEDKVLVDYDGVFSLPKKVASALIAAGYVIEDDE